MSEELPQQESKIESTDTEKRSEINKEDFYSALDRVRSLSLAVDHRWLDRPEFYDSEVQQATINLAKEIDKLAELVNSKEKK